MPLAVCRFSGLRITPCGELFSINLGSFSRNLGRQTSLFSVNLTSSLLWAEDLKESRTVATEVTVGSIELSVFLSTVGETFDTGFQTRFTGYPVPSVSTEPSLRAISVFSEPGHPRIDRMSSEVRHQAPEALIPTGLKI